MSDNPHSWALPSGAYSSPTFFTPVDRPTAAATSAGRARAPDAALRIAEVIPVSDRLEPVSVFRKAVFFVSMLAAVSYRVIDELSLPRLKDLSFRFD